MYREPWLVDRKGTQWSHDADMAQFTDFSHPEFWRSDDPSSPAYQPKEQE